MVEYSSIDITKTDEKTRDSIRPQSNENIPREGLNVEKRQTSPGSGDKQAFAFKPASDSSPPDVTEQARELAAYRNLVHYAPVGIFQSTLDGQIIKANPALADMLGYTTVAEYIASIDNIATDLYADPTSRKTLIDRISKYDRLTNFETRLKHKDSRIITCLVHARAARRRDGSIRYLEGFIQDITERKKIAEDLKTNEMQYRSIFENTGAGTIIIEKDTTISMMNAGFAKLYGYSKEEIEGKTKWPSFIADPKEKERMLRYHAQRRKTPDKVPVEYEFTLLDRSGNRKNIFLRVDMIAGTDRSVASLFDITSLKKAERHLRASESKLSGIVEAFEGFIYTCTKDYRISYMNKALKGFIGWDGKSRHCYKAIYGLDSACTWCARDQVFNGETVKLEFKNPMDNRWYYAVNVPVYETADMVTESQTVLIDIHRRKLAELAIREREAYLKKENKRLRATIKDRYKFGRIIGKSPAMQKVYELILRAAATDANVIIYGASGTGKELVARAIHDLSDRSEHRFIPVNCGAIPANLMESEFFGYKKGAFTGANQDKPGFFDNAADGTLFLDELGEITEEIQVKLLRVLEGRGFSALGDSTIKRPNVRVIAASNKNLGELLEKGRMREDFFYRIHVIPIYLPPLCERKGDISLLVEHFLKMYGDPEGVTALGGNEMEALMAHDWPGNVRELENTLQRFINLNSLDFMSVRHGRLPVRKTTTITAPEREMPLREAVLEFEKGYIANLLQKYQWNRTRVAGFLGIERKTLYLKMKRLGIDSPL